MRTEKSVGLTRVQSITNPELFVVVSTIDNDVIETVVFNTDCVDIPEYSQEYIDRDAAVEGHAYVVELVKELFDGAVTTTDHEDFLALFSLQVQQELALQLVFSSILGL